MQDDDNVYTADSYVISSRPEIPCEPILKKNPILPELEQFQLNDNTKLKISDLFVKVCNGKVRRNAIRRGLIYCCIINVCKKEMLTIDDKQLMSRLSIKISDVNKAQVIMYSVLKEEAEEISVEDLIKTKLKILDYNPDIISDLLIIYKRGMQKMSKFNSSRDETVCEAVVYYYLKRNLDEFDETHYFSKSKVSKDTVLKLFKAMEEELQ